MLIAAFNDADFASQIIAEYSDEIAAVIVEPLQRLIPPMPGFLETLREVTNRYGIVLIFDEVVTGFRLAYGGAQEQYGVTPDLCALGKIVGGAFHWRRLPGKRSSCPTLTKRKQGKQGSPFKMGP